MHPCLPLSLLDANIILLIHLLLFNSADHLISKKQFMDNSFPTCEQNIINIWRALCFSALYERLQTRSRKENGSFECQELTKQDGWLTDREFTHSTGEIIQVKCSTGNSTSAWCWAHKMTIYHSSHSLHTHSLYLPLNYGKGKQSKECEPKTRAMLRWIAGKKELRHTTKSLLNRSRLLCRKCFKCRQKQTWRQVDSGRSSTSSSFWEKVSRWRLFVWQCQGVALISFMPTINLP